MTVITREMVERALPPNLKNNATQSLVDAINGITNDPLVAEQIQKSFISYAGVLKEGKYRTEDYLHAVAYTSYKLMGDSNQEAYFKTFPHRYQLLISKGTAPKDIASYVSAYAKGQLVNKIMEQSLVPSWVLNQDMYQKALNTQFELMTDSEVSPKVRSDAANSILTHLTKPKEAGPLINIDLNESSGMNEIREALTKMAKQQQDLISSGVTTKSVAAQTIIDVEVKSDGTN